MTLREEIESKLHTCNQVLSGIVNRLYTSRDLASAAKEADTFKKDTLALIATVIDKRREELAQTIEPKELVKLAPEDFLLQRVVVTQQLTSVFRTAMHRPPNFAHNNRIIEPIACAQQLLQAALKRIPEDPSDPLMDSTDVFDVE
ncbi:hypothetical protein FJZ27_01635 [Candidatus Peribacteria bacterium]|nr:hypothetical protein [Candidatus Peribacteria bacterium]